MSDGQGLPQVTQAEMIYTVSELAATLRRGIDRIFPTILAIEGELSNVKLSQPAGHYYFTLKDAGASLRGVMFRGSAKSLAFVPVDGLKVLVRGRISYYEPRGEIQMVADFMGPAGLGVFHLEFRRVREILEREGLLASERKRPIPSFPRAVGVITSPQGAAIWDFFRICDQQNRLIPIVVIPARMQGDEAAGDIVRALSLAASREGIDVVVITRGGGSAEDLWVFNREEVARAILASPVPVVTAIGHEVDITVADLAADLRVATPTEAAKRLFFDGRQVLQTISRDRRRLVELANGRIQHGSRGLLDFKMAAGMFSRRMSHSHLVVVRAQERLVTGLKERLEQRRRTLGRCSSLLVHPSRRLIRISRDLGEHRGAIGRVARDLLSKFKSRLYFLHRRISHDNLVDIRSRRNALVVLKNDLSRGVRHFLDELTERQVSLVRRLNEGDPARPMGKGFFLLLREQGRGIVSQDNRPDLGERLSARSAGLSMTLQVTEIHSEEDRRVNGRGKGEHDG